MSQFALLRERRFGPLFWTQFLGAFNDNLFKTTFVFLVTFGALSDGLNGNVWTPVLHGLFILPFFLFSAAGGQLADKLDKAHLVRLVKRWELMVMALAAVGFLLGNVWILASALFLMGTQSAFFGPVKYGILPQAVRSGELVSANALIGTATFLAILLGTIGGGLVVAIPGASRFIALVVVLVAGAGVWMSSRIPEAPPTDPALRFDWNPARQAMRSFRYAARDASVLRAVVGVSWFWFLGATLVTVLPVYGRHALSVDETVVTLFLAVFCVGIGVGALLCSRAARFRVELGLVPLASAGLSLFALDLFFASAAYEPTALSAGVGTFVAAPGSSRILVDLLGLAVCGGLYTVPLNALIQARASAPLRSRILSATGILSALFMVASSGMTLALALWDVPTPWVFVVLAAMNGVVVVVSVRRAPWMLLRFANWCLVRVLYRLRLRGLHHVPPSGPVVLAANHVTYLDGLILQSSLSRRVRFVMYYKFRELPLVGGLLDRLGVIPIASRREDPVVLDDALDAIAKALEAGEVVCIFPEGTLTADGEMGTFRSGIERIVKRTPAPVVPLGLRGLAGSLFSRAPKRLRLWPSVGVVAGAPIAERDVTAELVRARVASLV